MARLNEPNTGTVHQEAIDALKKRYLRQNREIARANSQQSVRIRNLESETTRLLTENINLREQVIKLQASIDRRDRSRQMAEAVGATQKKLQDKVNEVNELVRELGQSVQNSQLGGRKSNETPATYVSRLPRGSVFGEALDGALPAIQEDARSRRSSLNDERRRSSLNFEEVELPPPIPAEDSDPDEDLEPPTSSLVESRSRRRRDSAIVQELDKPISVAQPTATTRPVKRKFGDKEVEHPSSPPDLEFRFSKVSERAIEAAKRMAVDEKQKRRGHSPEDDEVIDEPEQTAEKKQTAPSKTTGASRINQGVPAGSTKNAIASRKALGPSMSTIVTPYPVPRLPPLSLSSVRKEVGVRDNITPLSLHTGSNISATESTNLDPLNSPQKVSLAKEKDDGKSFEKVEKPDHPPPAVRSYRGLSMRDKDTPPPETDPASTVTSSTGRTARRARPAVSYAEPSLRAKMRREEKGLVDAVTGEGKQRRSTGSSSRISTGKKKDEEPEVKIKKEEIEDDGGWIDLPVQSKASEEPKLADEPKEDAFIASLDKQRERRERDLTEREKATEDETETGLPLPSSVMMHRKRRSSAFVTPTAGLYDEPPPPPPAPAPTSPGEVRRKIDIFEAPNSSPPDPIKKSSTKIDVEPIPFRSFTEPVKETRTASSDTKRLSRVHSVSALPEDGEKRMGTRRRSMML